MHVVNVGDALIGWYLRQGYRETGKSEPFPHGDDRFDAPLRDDLKFSGLWYVAGATPCSSVRPEPKAGASALASNRDGLYSD